MNKEDMIRMIESGEKLPDYCHEEFDNIIFCTIKSKEEKDVKVHNRLSRRIFTSYGRSRRMGISRLHGSRRTIRRNSKLQHRQKIHSRSVSKEE